MSYETIEVERRGAAVTIRLNRPDALNALNHTMISELLTALRETGADDAVRAVCLTGTGRGFSSGADLKDVGGRPMTPEGHPDLAGPMRELYSPVVSTIRAMPKPVVAAVNGGAAGIGCSIALACDLVVLHADAYLLLAFVHISLVPDGGALAFIASRVGAARAHEMAMLGERVSAAKALDWGLANRVLAEPEFAAGVTALVDQLAAGPTRSYAGSKRQLNAWLYPGLDDQLELEAVVQQEMAATTDFTEGVMAFLQKRPPAFTGN